MKYLLLSLLLVGCTSSPQERYSSCITTCTYRLSGQDLTKCLDSCVDLSKLQQEIWKHECVM